MDELLWKSEMENVKMKVRSSGQGQERERYGKRRWSGGRAVNVELVFNLQI